YFCIAANTRWGEENPELSYGTPSSYHIPYTDEYLAYLSAAITDAIKTTGIDGFMIDWVWMPNRKASKGKWIDAEKELYTQLMGEPFPGEENLSKEKELAYGQKAIDRCWAAIRKAAKDADPDCIIWLTSNRVNSPLVKNSNMYKEVDWFMGETGRLDEILAIQPIVGADTRLITCMSDYGGNDAAKDVPEALAAGVGVYGYAKPSNSRGIIPLDEILPRQMSELTGNRKRIAVMARKYHGMSVDSVWEDGKFVEPDSLPPLRLEFKARGNAPDTGRVDIEGNKAMVRVSTRVQAGRAVLTRDAETWPDEIEVHLLRENTGKPAATDFRVANGTVGISIVQLEETQVVAGKMKGGIDLNATWRGGRFFNGGTPETPIEIDAVQARTTEEAVEIVLPGILTRGNPKSICFEWGN
ncbi:hypothetical protein, partial [Haloferula sp. A504]|uniref:hypothetical protein n=1 Tax=Haloferula sp. A504 TaxID=3373601 RepID=UPI0031C8A981|nr:hypothetical protein [Verrucomicrobiaceae bacterium E54]